MSLTKLPTELVDDIAGYLTAEDLKALRLTHSSFKRSTETLLYRVACISKTKRDLARLLGIAGSPHLAPLPTQLVWYELADDENDGLLDDDRYNGREWAEIVPPLPPLPLPRTAGIEQRLRRMVGHAFWTVPFYQVGDERLPTKFDESRAADWQNANDAYLARRTVAQAATEQKILAAVRKLTSLRTLVARPMPPDYTLAVYRRYRLEANIMQRLNAADSWQRTPNGLFLFTDPCPALAHPIHTLALADRSASPALFASVYARSSAALFAHLRTLDLCLNWRGFSRADRTAQQAPCVLQCLRAATQLQRLTLCFETSNLAWNRGIVTDVLQTAFWPALHTLELVDVWYAETDFIGFVRRHAQTLRALVLLDCRGHTDALVRAMADTPDLRLTTFKVRADAPRKYEDSFKDGDNPYRMGNGCCRVSEPALLDYVNNVSPCNPLLPGRPYFDTGPFVWDPEACPRLAYLDHECYRTVESASLGPALEYRPELGSNVDEDEWNYYYLEYSDYEGQEDYYKHYDEEYNEDNEDDENEELPDELGEVRMPYTPADVASIRAWADAAAKADAMLLEEEDKVEKGEEDTGASGSLNAASAADSRAADRRQEARRRPENNPYWRWARVDADGARRDSRCDRPGTYVWKTKNPLGAHPTQLWLFAQEYADGTFEYGYGVDPLDYFSDWDSEGGANGDSSAQGSPSTRGDANKDNTYRNNEGSDGDCDDDIDEDGDDQDADDDMGTMADDAQILESIRRTSLNDRPSVVWRCAEPTAFGLALHHGLEDLSNVGHAVESDVTLYKVNEHNMPH
ncbi:F-box domain, cyclin-like protein [Niveomyces insectorum RCEF 264]|uniref:F-box domain, cyclin-like protein n=1 Tax=Niveomyces insectorum RCEF 264 TaxID=1081102 RepID=A0A167SGY2_9HYPO|nr:F-box domain, cyclin-like protein [Niveomyces insectorum RCEF 264]